MKIGNTSERWGPVSQLLHWVIVALVATQFTLAYLAAELPLGLHKLALLARHPAWVRRPAPSSGIRDRAYRKT